jgi:hypothetical protein
MNFVQSIRDLEKVDLPYHALRKLLEGTIVQQFSYLKTSLFFA